MNNSDLAVIDTLPVMVNGQQFARIVGVSTATVSQWVAEERVHPVGAFVVNGGRNMMFLESEALNVRDEQRDYRFREYRRSADGCTFADRFDQVLAYIADNGTDDGSGGVVLDMRCCDLADAVGTYATVLNRVVNEAIDLGFLERLRKDGSYREKVYHLNSAGVDYVNEHCGGDRG